MTMHRFQTAPRQATSFEQGDRVRHRLYDRYGTVGYPQKRGVAVRWDGYHSTSLTLATNLIAAPGAPFTPQCPICDKNHDLDDHSTYVGGGRRWSQSKGYHR